MIFSVMRDRTKVTDIGRKSLGCFGFAVLGTGHILARFHCVGTVDVLIDRLMSSARVLLNTAAPRRMYHADRPSRPVAVGFSLSIIRNILCSVICQTPNHGQLLAWQVAGRTPCPWRCRHSAYSGSRRQRHQGWPVVAVVPSTAVPLPHILGVHPPVELLQARPVILYSLLANSSRDGTRFLDTASSHKLILLAQQRLDEWGDLFRITRLDGDRFLRVKLIQQPECDVVEIVECLMTNFACVTMMINPSTGNI